MAITIFPNIKNKVSPKYTTVDAALEAIRLCGLQKQIDEIRAEKDKKKKSLLKGLLPCICFSGIFPKRYDNYLKKHSGFVIVDIDHIGDIEEVEKRKEIVKTFNYVYSCFVSPSGDGLKVLVRIPPVIEDHRAHYAALEKVFNQADPTSKNESRVCYASADANIYINRDAVEFTEKAEYVKLEKSDKPHLDAVQTNYFRLGVAVNKVRNASDGDKRNQLLKAAVLMGGYIAGGVVEENEAVRVLEMEIQKRDIDDFKAAQKTIADGISYGKSYPIFEQEEYKKYDYREKPKEAINSDFTTTEDEENSYIEQIRDGTFEMGKSTGIKTLDPHWLLKDASLVVINGHDNVGKSVVLWYIATLSALFYGWKWIIYSSENKAGGVKRKILEFWLCKPIEKFTESELEEGYVWFKKHFVIIKNTELYTYSDIIKIGKSLNEIEQRQGFLVDPYNSLWRNTTDTHEYDYRAMTEFRQFISQTKCGVYLNCHAITEALRRRYPKEHMYAGFPMPPDKSDTEGGGKFSNKADDFLTIHRMTQHPNLWKWTEIHVKKIKEMETGGKHTPMEEPVKITMIKDGCGFEDKDGNNPVLQFRNKQSVQNEIPYGSITTPNYEVLRDFSEPIKVTEEDAPF